MKITLEISDQHAEIIAAALLDIIDQMQPTRLEPTHRTETRQEFVILLVNGIYLTEDLKTARCIDIRNGGIFLCEIDGEKYPFWQNGEPVYLPTLPTYPTKIIEKIIQ